MGVRGIVVDEIDVVDAGRHGQVEHRVHVSIIHFSVFRIDYPGALRFQAPPSVAFVHDKNSIPYLVIRMQFNEKEGIDKSPILTGLEEQVDITFPQNIPLYFENLTGLGILSRELGSLSNIEKCMQRDIQTEKSMMLFSLLVTIE